MRALTPILLAVPSGAWRTRGSPVPDPRQNRLLAALPEAEFHRLAPTLEPVLLTAGTALYESGRPQPYLYFPASGIVSLLYLLEDGASTEIALTGREGVVGVSLFMGGGVTPSRAVVQIAGHAWRMRAAAMKKASTAARRCRGCSCATPRR